MSYELYTAWVIGDLNIRNQDPRDSWEEEIADLLDESNLIDTSRKFIQRQSCQYATLQRNRWTWRTKRRTEVYQQGRWIYSQSDYIMAREGDLKHIQKSRDSNAEIPHLGSPCHRLISEGRE